MKRFSLVVMIMSAAIFSKAQSLEDITKMITANNFKAAKTAIDTYLSDPKNSSKADGWYFKGRIYNSLSYDNGASLDDKSAYKTASYEAFRKTQQLDPQDLRLKLEFYKSYLDLYFGFYDLGANLFNAKKFDDAFKAFTKAIEVKDYILSKNYTYTEAKIYALDTALVLNAAISASQAKKDEVAVTYYKKLVDANVSGKGYEEVYEYLVNYYNTKDDQVNLKPLLLKAKQYYPANDYWSDVEIRAIGKTGDQAALFAKYEEMIANNPSNFNLGYNYAIELYNSIYGKDAKPANETAAKAKLTEVLKKARINDKGNDATMLMSNHLFNAASDLSIAASLVRGVKPEDVKKKKELTISANKLMDDFIPYGEAAIKYFDAQPSLKPVQKANYKIVLGYMSDVYNNKKDAKKAAEYDKKKMMLN